MITFVKADIFDSPAKAIVNTTNTTGNMAGGLARAFRLRYPKMNVEYEARCQAGLVRVGVLDIHPTNEVDDHIIINFCTKDHISKPGEIEYILTGLASLRSWLRATGHSVAIPALGCNLAGLQWSQVRPLIEHALEDLPNDIYVHEPLEG